MADETKNFDNMSDEDFLKLSEEDAAQAIETQTPPQEEEENQNEDENQNQDDQSGSGDESSSDGDESGESNDGSVPNADGSEEKSDDPKQGNQDPLAGAGETPQNAQPKSGEQPAANTGEKGKKPEQKPGNFKLPDGVTGEQVTTALDFYSKITAPFKADGKDFSVRSVDDAIRLMQQGVNYSRRMQELKPMKNFHRVLQDHGLTDMNKISFLIDVSKGDKTAITKLLKDNNLDPMDLDISVESGYQAKSYAGNPQDNAFRDALENTISNPDGQALVGDIHKSWDDSSKARLRENPGILGNLMDMKQSGVYDKIVAELNYQRGLGYLTDVPYLQAFDQVGEAMKNAGVFNKAPQPAPAAAPMGHLQNNTQQQVQPVASGARKVTAPKNTAPNPHLSSTPPSKQTNTGNGKVNFDSMSDEDFLKMAPPS